MYRRHTRPSTMSECNQRRFRNSLTPVVTWAPAGGVAHRHMHAVWCRGVVTCYWLGMVAAVKSTSSPPFPLPTGHGIRLVGG
jgi:hypothetical protein